MPRLPCVSFVGGSSFTWHRSGTPGDRSLLRPPSRPSSQGCRDRGCQAHSAGRTRTGNACWRRCRHTVRWAVPGAGPGRGPLHGDLTRGLVPRAPSRWGPGRQGRHDGVEAAGHRALPLWARHPLPDLQVASQMLTQEAAPGSGAETRRPSRLRAELHSAEASRVDLGQGRDHSVPWFPRVEKAHGNSTPSWAVWGSLAREGPGAGRALAECRERAVG